MVESLDILAVKFSRKSVAFVKTFLKIKKLFDDKNYQFEKFTVKNPVNNGYI